jgi:hypothetical protein
MGLYHPETRMSAELKDIEFILDGGLRPDVSAVKYPSGGQDPTGSSSCHTEASQKILSSSYLQ